MFIFRVFVLLSSPSPSDQLESFRCKVAISTDFSRILSPNTNFNRDELSETSAPLQENEVKAFIEHFQSHYWNMNQQEVTSRTANKVAELGKWGSLFSDITQFNGYLAVFIQHYVPHNTKFQCSQFRTVNWPSSVPYVRTRERNCTINHVTFRKISSPYVIIT